MNEICWPTMLLLKATVGDNLGHLYTIPVQWNYENHENGDGVAYKYVTKMACVCGAVKEINIP